MKKWEWTGVQLTTLLMAMVSQGAVTFSPEKGPIGARQTITIVFGEPMRLEESSIGCTSTQGHEPWACQFTATWSEDRTSVVIAPLDTRWPDGWVMIGAQAKSVSGECYYAHQGFEILNLTISIDWNTLVLNGLVLDKPTTVLMSYDCRSWEPWRTFRATNVTHTLHGLPLNQQVYFKARQD